MIVPFGLKYVAQAMFSFDVKTALSKEHVCNSTFICF